MRKLIIGVAVVGAIVGAYFGVQSWMDYENAVDRAYLAQFGTKGPVVSRDEVKRDMDMVRAAPTRRSAPAHRLRSGTSRGGRRSA